MHEVLSNFTNIGSKTESGCCEASAGACGNDQHQARDSSESIYSSPVEELVAIGAAIAANCEPCFKYHYDKAIKLGVSKGDMIRAVRTAQMVKDAPARKILKLAEQFLEGASNQLSAVQSCDE